MPQLRFPAIGDTISGPQVTFSWEASAIPDGSPVSYELYISESPVFVNREGIDVVAFFALAILLGIGGLSCGDEPTAPEPAGVATVSFTVKELELNLIHYWKVRAKNREGTFTESSVSAFTCR